MHSPRAAIFDLDGTLADTFGLVVASYHETCRAFDGPSLSREEVIARFGPTEAQMLRKDLPAELHQRAIEHYRQRYTQDHAKLVTVFDGVPQMLRALREKNIPMGIVTGKGRDTADITLAELGWTDFFTVVMTGDESPREKPDPAGVLIAAQTLDVAPADCIFVGDSPADIGAARNAGMRSVWASWHRVYEEEVRKLGPDVIAGSPADVTAMFP